MRQPRLRQVQHLRQQQGTGKKAQLTIEIPQRAGIRHLVPARCQKRAALSRAAAQASPGAHQGKRDGRQQRSRTDVNQKQNARRLQQAADDDQGSGADTVKITSRCRDGDKRCHRPRQHEHSRCGWLMFASC